ncbi:hypothetical protein V865_007615 [Kwoniella europaea PYCC6329]|uniref:C2H2-type domain-containing protein n=1 Tax=Kwoniella europaea PYCC6329 TaxID=1423913 RepID=A0AAX4KSP7_9TREE
MFSRNFKGPRHSKTTRDYSSDDSLSETERQAIHIELEEMTLHPQGRAGAVGRVQPCRGAKRKAQKSIDKAYLKEKVWRDAQEVLRISKRRKMTELTERGLSTSGRGKGREIIDSQSRSDIGHSFKMLIHGNTGRRGMNSGEGEEGIRQAEGVEGDSETHHEDCGEVSSQESRLCDDSVQEDGEGLQGEGEGETSASDDNDGSEDRSELPASDDLTENVSEDVDDHSSTSQDGPSCIDIQDESDGCKEQDGHETDEGEMSNGDGSNPSHDETSSSSLSNLPENQTEEEPAESQDSGGPDVSQSQILTDGMLLPIEDPTVKGEDQVRDRCIICFNNLETIRCNSVRNDLDPILVIWTCNQCQTVPPLPTPHQSSPSRSRIHTGTMLRYEPYPRISHHPIVSSTSASYCRKDQGPSKISHPPPPYTTKPLALYPPIPGPHITSKPAQSHSHSQAQHSLSHSHSHSQSQSQSSRYQPSRGAQRDAKYTKKEAEKAQLLAQAKTIARNQQVTLSERKRQRTLPGPSVPLINVNHNQREETRSQMNLQLQLQLQNDAKKVRKEQLLAIRLAREEHQEMIRRKEAEEKKVRRIQLQVFVHARPTPCEWKGCEAILNSWATLERHIHHSHLHPSIIHGSNQVRCQWQGCNEVFRGRDECERHVLVGHMGAFSARCPFDCVFEGPSFPSLMAHISRRHPKATPDDFIPGLIHYQPTLPPLSRLPQLPSLTEPHRYHAFEPILPFRRGVGNRNRKMVQRNCFKGRYPAKKEFGDGIDYSASSDSSRASSRPSPSVSNSTSSDKAEYDTEQDMVNPEMKVKRSQRLRLKIVRRASGSSLGDSLYSEGC